MLIVGDRSVFTAESPLRYTRDSLEVSELTQAKVFKSPLLKAGSRPERFARWCREVSVRYCEVRVRCRSASEFMASTIHAGVILSASAYCIAERNSATLAIRSFASLCLANQQRIGNGCFFRNITTLRTPRWRRLRGFDSHVARAGIKKKIKKAVNDFGVRLPECEEYTPEQLAVSLPPGLASFEGLYLLSWVASLRGLLPGLGFLFAAAELIVTGVMLVNCVVGQHAMRHSINGILELPFEFKVAKPDFLDVVFSLALSFVPFANLYLWSRFVSKQRRLPARAKAALAANAFIYEFPRCVSLLVVLSGGLRVCRQVFFVCNAATLLGSLHRVVEEARIKNEKILVEVSRALARKKAQYQKPEEKEISADARESIDRLRELEEFDMLLAQHSSPNDAAFSAKVKDWSVGETMEWIGQQGLARYATTFAENCIDGELLLQLTNDDLRDELEILSFGDRKKLCLLIQQLKER